MPICLEALTATGCAPEGAATDKFARGSGGQSGEERADTRVRDTKRHPDDEAYASIRQRTPAYTAESADTRVRDAKHTTRHTSVSSRELGAGACEQTRVQGHTTPRVLTGRRLGASAAYEFATTSSSSSRSSTRNIRVRDEFVHPPVQSSPVSTCLSACPPLRVEKATSVLGYFLSLSRLSLAVTSIITLCYLNNNDPQHGHRYYLNNDPQTLRASQPEAPAGASPAVSSREPCDASTPISSVREESAGQGGLRCQTKRVIRLCSVWGILLALVFVSLGSKRQAFFAFFARLLRVVGQLLRMRMRMRMRSGGLTRATPSLSLM